MANYFSTIVMKKADLGYFLFFKPMHKLHPAAGSFEINDHGASVAYHYDDKHL